MVFDLSTRMKKDEFYVIVCSIGRKGDGIESEIRQKLKSSDIKTISLDKPFRKGRFVAVWELCLFLRKYRVDILNTHCSSPDFHGRLAAFFARTPFIFTTIHSTKGYSSFMERLFSKITTKYIAISKTVKQYATSELKISPSKIEVIYNAVGTDRFNLIIANPKFKSQELGIVDNARIITSVGNVAECKGFFYLFKAAKEISKDFPDVHFLIVGDNRAEPEFVKLLKKMIKAEHLEDRITFIGVRVDIPQILSITEIFVLPSLWEGLSIALLEAMAAGIPVVVTKVGSNPEVVTNGANGFIVPPKDSSALSKKIEELLNDPRKEKKLGLAGQKMVREFFTLDKMVLEYERFYLKYFKNIK